MFPRRIVGIFVLAIALLVLCIGGCRGAVERVYDDAILGGEDGGPGDIGKGGDAAGGSDAAAPSAPAKISGTVIGLVGTGLTLQNNGGDDLSVTAGGAFAFTTPIAPGLPYAVTIRAQPSTPTQNCAVTNGAGTAQGVDVINVTVTCTTSSYPIGGTVVGLAGTGLILLNNGGNELPVGKNGDFTFTQPVQSGASFNISVKTQPTGPVQTCSVSGATGTVVSAAVSSVVVNCGTNTYTVGGTVTGLAGTLVLRNNGGDNRTVTANGSFAFPTPILSGATYSVTVLTQPTYPPVSQTCSIANGSGTIGSANVGTVAVTCTTATYTVGGTVSGLNSQGLVLQNNGGNNKTITTSGGFTFAGSVTSGSPYNVTILTQPANDKCVVSAGGGGTVTNANISNVSITCSPLIVLSENFDGVAAGSLPPGWTSTILRDDVGGISPWVTQTDNVSSAPNAAFVSSYGNVTDIVLNSPPITISSPTAQLSFWNSYDTEGDYDGCVLEISIAGGPFQDILAAGGAFVSGGYNDPNLDGSQSPLAGRAVWVGDQTVQTVVNLPAGANGKSIVLRWRHACDEGYAEVGWWIDNVVVKN